jgi:hypothetical protein
MDGVERMIMKREKAIAMQQTTKSSNNETRTMISIVHEDDDCDPSQSYLISHAYSCQEEEYT